MTTEMKSYEVIVLGAGSMGMAAGAFLAKRGAKVLLLDAFDPPHTFGSHHGDTRMIRHAYGEGGKYVPLALRAQALWEELERETGRRVFEKAGVLGIGLSRSPFLEEMVRSARQYRLHLDMLSPDEAGKRWPGLRLPEGYVGLFEPDAGYLYCEEAIRAYRLLAERHGARLMTNTRALSVEYHADGVTVCTERGTFHGDRLIVTAGAWIGSLLPELALPLRVVRTTVVWYEADEALYGAGRFPAFFMETPEEMFYGFPSVQGAGLKIGSHDAGEPVSPDRINRRFGAGPNDEGGLAAVVERFFPYATRRVKKGSVCMYTKTPDEDFIIDRHPEHGHVLIVSACSGHGFKFAGAIGEIAAQWTLTGKATLDVSAFRLSRFVKPFNR